MDRGVYIYNFYTMDWGFSYVAYIDMTTQRKELIRSKSESLAMPVSDVELGAHMV